MLDCCLVNMPYTDLKRPSLGLGLLQGVLKREGFSVKSVYANLLQTEKTGPWFYSLVTQAAARTMIGDWSFARAAFPDHVIDDEAYLDYFCRTLSAYSLHDVDGGRIRQGVYWMRQQAEEFLDELTGQILALKPRVVGCTSTFMQHVASLALLRRLRQEAPYELVTMIGGANCEAEMGLATHRHFPWIDYVVSGEADDIIAPLVRLALTKGRQATAADLPLGAFGPIHRREGYPVTADGRAPRATASGFENWVVPEFDDYFQTLDQCPDLKASISPALPYETSRGCWWGEKPGCRFCGLCGQGKEFRAKPVERSLEVLRRIVERYGLKKIGAADNIMDMRFFKTFLPKLAEAPWADGLRIFYETRSLLGPEQIAALRRAGVHHIQAGVESLHSQCLRLMNKGCEAWQNIQLLKWCLQEGVYVVWHILYDLPGERDQWYEEMAADMALLHHLPPPVLFTMIKFDRFSHYRENPELYGLDLEPLADYAFVYPLGPEAIHDLAHDFDDKQRAAFRLNPMAPLIVGRGFDLARQAYKSWRAEWLGEPRPRLIMRESPQGLVIEDTRAIATAPRHPLTGLERQIYLDCRTAKRRDRLSAEMTAQGHDPAAVEAAVARLLADKLSLAIDGRLLSLAIEEPKQPYPLLADFPLGGFSANAFWQARKARLAAGDC